MAAPDATVWGSIVGGYCRLGIYKSLTSTATQTTVTVQIWVWTKYSCSDTANTLYYNNLASSGSATTSIGAVSLSTSIASGSGWSTSNQQKLKEYSYTYTRGKAAVTRYLYAKLANVDKAGGTMYASTTFTIPKLATYTISYNANGGSSAPASHSKYYGENITLSDTKPKREGYSFLGWATSASDSVAYAAGATYSGNANLTLYAKWQANTYTVSYNANGGSGAPANQTKTYGTALTLSSTKPTRANYTFLGWATTKTAITAQYSAGGSYTANAAATLFAVWKLAYTAPSIYNLKATRCDASGNADESGTYALITCDWVCFDASEKIITVNVGSATSGSSSYKVKVSGASGIYSRIQSNCNPEQSYTIKLTIADATDSSTATTTLPGVIYPWDALAGGNGIAFGKNAEKEGVAEFAFAAEFNKPVYGNVLGLNKLPEIPANSDLNDYIATGAYAVYNNANAATITNLPVDRAGRLEVYSSTGEGIRAEQWSYVRQRYYPYNASNAVWERDIARGSDNVWHYYEWWRSSLTPAASTRVYDKSAITLALSSNAVIGVTNTYTRLPFNKTAFSMGNRLSVSNNCVVVGAGIDYVKISGQTLVKCGSWTGNRHARLQKVSGGTTSSIAWACVYATESSNTLYSFTPVVIPVAEGDSLCMVYYTGDTADSNQAGSAANGWQSYITVETL